MKKVTDVFKKQKKQISEGAWALPVVKIGKKRWFRDDRLLEFRNITKPWERITFDEYFQKYKVRKCA